MAATDSAKRILIVDDEPTIRRMLSVALRQRELIVDEADGGDRALALIRENRYAVVLLDLFMPNVDGFAVLDSLRVDEIQGPPVVLVVTGADRKTIQRLDAKQIHGVIRKPFDIDELVNLVVACSEIKSRRPYGAMALATMLGGAHMLSHWLK